MLNFSKDWNMVSVSLEWIFVPLCFSFFVSRVSEPTLPEVTICHNPLFLSWWCQVFLKLSHALHALSLSLDTFVFPY